MISKAETRFINHWEEQKSGTRIKYYLQFTVAWTVVSFLVIFFLTKLFTDLWETGGKNLIFILAGIAVITGFLATHFNYVSSEKKYHKILKRQKEGLN